MPLMPYLRKTDNKKPNVHVTPNISASVKKARARPGHCLLIFPIAETSSLDST